MKYLLTFFFMITLVSCKKNIDVDLPDLPSQLVVNCLFNPNQKWIVNVSQTLGITDTAQHAAFVDNALVSLYEDDIWIANLTHTNKGNYTLDAFPVPEQNYTIKVQAAGFETAEATAKIPVQGVMPYSATFSTDTIYIIDELQSLMAVSPVSVSFYDIPNVKNYYQVKLIAYDSLYLTANAIHQDNLFETFSLRTKSPLAETFNEAQYYVLLNDETQDGNEINLDCTTWANLFYPSVVGYEGDSLITPRRNLELYVELNTLSQDMYLFEKSYIQNRYNITNPFAEPINVYSNVKNGLGIFAGYQQNRIRVY